MSSACPKDVELVTPSVVSAPIATKESSVISLLVGADRTHWTSVHEDPIDNHFVFDFVDHRAPARIEWSDWGREDSAAYMKLAVSDDLHAGWVRVCGWSAQQTTQWQSHEIAPENQCRGRYWKITIKRAHKPGFGLQLRGLRLYACAKPPLPHDKLVQSTPVRQATPQEHTRKPLGSHSQPLPTKKPLGKLLMSATHNEVEKNLVELVQELRAENAQLATKLHDVQRNMSKAHAEALAERDEHLHALQQQLQDEAQKAMREQARALKLEGDLLHLRRKLHENHATNEHNGTASEDTTCEGKPVSRKSHKRVEEERDEAIRARKQLESALSQVLGTHGWHAAPVNAWQAVTCKLSTSPHRRPSLASTQASTQVSPESSPRALPVIRGDMGASDLESSPPSSPRLSEPSPPSSPPLSPRSRAKPSIRARRVAELAQCF